MRYLLILCMVMLHILLAATDLKENNATGYINDPIVRLHMLREAKYLMQEHEMLQNRLKSWMIHKQKLIARFEAENRSVEQMHLGKDGRYGAKLAQERRKRFYTTLDLKERRIRESLAANARRLKALQKEFRYRYAVELTKEEIFEGKRPRIEDKEQKTKLLQEYIRYSESYEKLRAMNARFDQAENLMHNIAKINEKEQNFEQNLTKRAQLNREKMLQYRLMERRLREEFYNRYHMPIYDIHMARQFLKNLQKSER